MAEVAPSSASSLAAESRALAYLRNAATSFEQQVGKLSDDNASAAELANALRAQVEALATAFEVKLAASMKEVQEETDQSDHEIAVLNRTVGDLHSDIAGLHGDITGLENKIVRKDQEIAAGLQLLKERDEAYYALKEQYDERGRKISEVTHERDLALTEVAARKADIEMLNTEIVELKDTLEHVRNERDEHLMTVQKLDECLTLKAKELVEMSEFLAQLRVKLNTAETKASELEVECGDLKEDLEEKTQQCKALQTSNNELSRSNIRLEAELRDCLTRLQSELTEKDDIRSKLITEQVIKESVLDEKNRLMQELGLLRGAQMEQLDEVMALLKAEAITLDRSGCKAIDKILNRAEGQMLKGGDRAAQFKQAQVAIKKEVIGIAGEQVPGECWNIKPSEIPKIPAHNLRTLRRHLQVLSVMYDCLEDDYKNDNLITTTTEIVNNAPILLSLCRYIKACSPQQGSYSRLISSSPRDSVVMSPHSQLSTPAQYVVTPGTGSRLDRPRSVSPSPRGTPLSNTFPKRSPGRSPSPGFSMSMTSQGSTPGDKTHTLRSLSPGPQRQSPMLATFSHQKRDQSGSAMQYNM